MKEFDQPPIVIEFHGGSPYNPPEIVKYEAIYYVLHDCMGTWSGLLPLWRPARHVTDFDLLNRIKISLEGTQKPKTRQS